MTPKKDVLINSSFLSAFLASISLFLCSSNRAYRDSKVSESSILDSFKIYSVEILGSYSSGPLLLLGAADPLILSLISSFLMAYSRLS